MDELRARILQLETQLENERQINKSLTQSTVRQKIDKMSAEVVDDNPYRFTLFFNVFFRFLICF